MANFNEAIAVVLRHEDAHLSGVLTEDSGGRTRYGVAERFHPKLGDGFYCGPAEAALETAQQIYRTDYWNAIHGDEILDQQVAAKLLDMAVNMGVRQAVVLCQRAMNAFTKHHIAEDGVPGPVTVAAVNGCDPAILLAHLRDVSVAFYRHIAAIRPGSEQYLHGWLARANA